MLDTAELRKARGAFFTPPPLTDFLAEWALRSPADRVLEPSCGEAGFLVSAIARLRALGAENISPDQLEGLDIHAESVAEADRIVREVGGSANLSRADFFEISPAPLFGEFDAVIGNPPYVRYQDFAGDARAKGRRAALAQGVRLPGLASSWAAFTVHAASFLQPEGRLALVLPGELLSVNYAAPVRRYLLERFASVQLIVFETRVFPGVSEDVVLLLAEGSGPTDHFDVYQAKDLASLNALEFTNWFPFDSAEKWLPALLPPGAAEIYRQALEGDAFGRLEDWGETDLGMVTGNNNFFTLSVEKARKLGLRDGDLTRISPPSSRHLRGLTFTDKTWREMADAGARVYLFDPSSRPSTAAQRYIEEGEERGVPNAYKCRVRTPWWRVPKVRTPDLFFTYMNHDAPRLVANRAGVPHLNSVHGVSLALDYRTLGRDLLPMAMLNSVTMLGAELVGRSYGGGILKIEPKEADRMPVPTPAAIQAAAKRLRPLRPQLASLLRQRKLDEVIRLVDRALLLQHLRHTTEELANLTAARQHMFNRRSRKSE